MKWLGHIASASAALDFRVNTAIWELANVERFIGACLTTQIMSPAARFRALIALVQVRGGTKEMVDKINKFKVKAEKVARRRNEYVHDPWTSAGKVHRIHVTMEGNFNFDFTETPVEDLKRLYDDIQKRDREFVELCEEIFLALPPWQRTQFKRSKGIRFLD
jgi:hypothetical protein